MPEETTPNTQPPTPPQDPNMGIPPVPPNPSSIPPQPLNQPKSSTALYIAISVLILILLSAIAAGAYYYYIMDDPAPEEGARQVEDARPAQPLPESDESDATGLTPGNTIEEIEQDLSSLELDDLDSELAPVESDANEVE